MVCLRRVEVAGSTTVTATSALAPIAGRHHVADDGLGQHEQAAAADALDRAERDQLGHAAGKTGQRRADEEDDDRGDEQVLPAVLVAQLAPDLGGGRGGEY